jgi:hypothetical protein
LQNANTSFNATNNVTSMPSLAMIHVADNDFAAQVPSSLKQQICKGEYITLAPLSADELSENCSVSLFRLNANGQIETVPKLCKKTILHRKMDRCIYNIYICLFVGTQRYFRNRQAISPASWSKINNATH